MTWNVGEGRPLYANRGVSSTVKLPVSKTGLGGSNPSAPARVWEQEGQVE